MFISNFNRFFEKHGKKTYIALGIVISAMFVIFVTPGNNKSGCSGNDRVAEIYGKPIMVNQMPKIISQAKVEIWLETPEYCGYELWSSDRQLLDWHLFNERRLHLADMYEIPAPTKERVLEYLKTFPILADENGAFSQIALNNFLAYLKSMGIDGGTFDQLISDTLRIADLEKKLTEEITLSNEELAPMFTDYQLKYALVPLDPKESLPSDDKVKEYFANNRENIKMPKSRNAIVASFSVDNIIANPQSAPAELAERLNPSDDVLRNEFDARKDFDQKYIGKEFQDVKDAMKADYVRNIAAEYLHGIANNLSTTFTTKVANETNEATLARFRTAASKAGATIMETGMQLENAKISGLSNKLNDIISREILNLNDVCTMTHVFAMDDQVVLAMLSDIQDTKIPENMDDGNMELIRNILLREEALKYYDEQLKKPFDEAIAASRLVMEDKTLTQEERLAKINALDASLPQSQLANFYVAEKRDFVYATLPYSDFEAAIPEITEEMIAERFASSNPEDGKTLENSRDEIIAEIRKNASAELANAAADQLQNQLNDQWWTSKEAGENPDGEAILKALAGNYTVTPVMGLGINDLALAPQKAVTAARRASENAPIASVSDDSAAYVICLLKRHQPTLTDPRADQMVMNTLISTYRKNMEQELASVRANTIHDTIVKDLAEGKNISECGQIFLDAPVFMDADSYFNPQRISKAFQQIGIMPALGAIPGLESAPVNSVLAPLPLYTSDLKTPRGFVILYVAGKTLAVDSVEADKVAQIKEQLLQQKKAEVLLQIYQQEDRDNAKTVVNPNLR